MDQSKLFSLSWRDIVKALITSAFTAVFTSVGVLVKNKVDAQDFTLTETDMKMVVFLSIFTFLGDVSRRFMTDESGKLSGFKHIGGRLLGK